MGGWVGVTLFNQSGNQIILLVGLHLKFSLGYLMILFFSAQFVCFLASLFFFVYLLLVHLQRLFVAHQVPEVFHRTPVTHPANGKPYNGSKIYPLHCLKRIFLQKIINFILSAFQPFRSPHFNLARKIFFSILSVDFELGNDCWQGTP